MLVAAAALVAVGGSRFGADGGGLLVLLAGYAVLIARLGRFRATLPRTAAVAAALALVALALVGLDAALGGSSHVTDAAGGGPQELLSDLWHRLRLSWTRVTDDWGPALVAVASIAVLARIATRRPRRPLTDALLVAIAVSVVVNDTPGDVLGVGAAAAFAVSRWERHAGDDPNELVRLRAMRRTTLAAALALAAFALVAAGCESPEDAAPTPETVVGELPTETTGGNEDLPALALEGDAANGKDIFAAKGCGGCHTLSDAGASGTVGPNLDDAKPSYELAVTRVTKGQGAMPSFESQLSAQEIADVAQYVVDATQG